MLIRLLLMCVVCVLAGCSLHWGSSEVKPDKVEGKAAAPAPASSLVAKSDIHPSEAGAGVPLSLTAGYLAPGTYVQLLIGEGAKGDALSYRRIAQLQSANPLRAEVLETRLGISAGRTVALMLRYRNDDPAIAGCDFPFELKPEDGREYRIDFAEQGGQCVPRFFVVGGDGLPREIHPGTADADTEYREQPK